MIINAYELLNILKKIDFSQNTNVCICFSEEKGFYFKNNENDLSILEKELNNQYVKEEYISIKDIANHLNISKPTVEKILKDENIEFFNINNSNKILKSDYVTFLLKHKN